ncbi:MAG: HDOD domain-containing protein [Fibrobacterota bacterium]
MKKVLFVDNSEKWIEIYKTVFYNTDEWECHYAQDVLAAVDYLNYISVDVIVVELKLPLFDGTQILEYVKKRYPDIIRIILTDCTDITRQIRVVRLAHQFLKKTRSVTDIEQIINNIYRLHRIVISSKARQIVGAMDSLPALPDAYYQLKSELNSADPSLKKIARIVESDMGLSLTILKIVNSAFFGVSQRVGSVSQAVSLLGTEILKSLLVSAHVFSHFESKDICTSVTDVMNHSKLVAAFTDAICEREGVKKQAREAVFMAALLHDIGRLVFETSFHDVYKKAIGISQVTSESLSETEKSTIGVNHSEVGAYLLGVWGFNLSTVEAVAFHHSPSQLKGRKNVLLSILHVADIVALEKMKTVTSFGTEYMDREYVDNIMGLDSWDTWRAVCVEKYNDLLDEDL